MPAIEGAEPLTKIGFANTSIPSPFPTKKRTSHMRGSLTLPEFVPKNQGYLIWRNAFGAKIGVQAKQRVEVYLTYAKNKPKARLDAPQTRPADVRATQAPTIEGAIAPYEDFPPMLLSLPRSQHKNEPLT